MNSLVLPLGKPLLQIEQAAFDLGQRVHQGPSVEAPLVGFGGVQGLLAAASCQASQERY